MSSNCSARPTIAGTKVTDEMVTRIAKACGTADYRFESEQDVVERVIFHLAAEIERAARSPKRKAKKG